uniref:Mitochondrial ribosomal protein L20 n=1 Tax=Hucho hucho TaxID=62062 RepID=A0A4W5RT26_9TELE
MLYPGSICAPLHVIKISPLSLSCAYDKSATCRCLWISRIAAASQEHGMNTEGQNVEVNRRVLSDLAITEPKSFLSLAKLVRARQQEGFGAALGDGKEPPGVVSHIVTLQ